MYSAEEMVVGVMARYRAWNERVGESLSLTVTHLQKGRYMGFARLNDAEG